MSPMPFLAVAEERAASDRRRAAELEVGLASIGALFVARISELASIASELVQADLELAVVNDRLGAGAAAPRRASSPPRFCRQPGLLHPDLPYASAEGADLAAEQLAGASD